MYVLCNDNLEYISRDGKFVSREEAVRFPIRDLAKGEADRCAKHFGEVIAVVDILRDGVVGSFGERMDGVTYVANP